MNEAEELPRTGKQQQQAKLYLEMLRIDRPKARMIGDATHQLEKDLGQRHIDEFQSFDDLMRFRFDEGGCYLYLTAMVFCCDLELSKADIDGIMHIAFPAYMIMLLCNDLDSFERETCLSLQVNGNMSNSLWYLMKTLNISIQDARGLAKQKIKRYEEEHDLAKGNYVRDHPEGMTYGGAMCDRYHAWTSLLDDPVFAGFEYVRFEDEKLSYTALVDMLPKRLTAQRPSVLKKADQIHTVKGMELSTNLGKDTEIVLGPINHLRANPSKNVRGNIIQALNVWFNASPSTLARVERITTLLHESSLLLDDIEDGSPLRRGRPTAHRIYGQAQTINSANFLYVLAINELLHDSNTESHKRFMNGLMKLHIGQSHDLHWRDSLQTPQISEYFDMISQKTGGLFVLLCELLCNESNQSTIDRDDIHDLMISLGKYFQIRDDFINLSSAQYSEQKGFAEDLDEGKFSLPLIHVLQNSPNRTAIQNLLQERLRVGSLSPDLKLLILDEMKQAKTFEYTKNILIDLENGIQARVARLEAQTRVTNHLFRLALDRLAIENID